MRKDKITSLCVACLGIGCVAFTFLSQPNPLLIWNASASAPIGLYRITQKAITIGDLVLIKPPDDVRELAAKRGYLPLGVPLIKHVAALSGDQICADDSVIFINKRAVTHRLITDSLGRPMPIWTGCRELSDEVFPLMADVPTSFDGRYFGPVPMGAVGGTLTPIWTPLGRESR